MTEQNVDNNISNAELRDNDQRARQAMSIFWIIAGISFIALLATLYEVRMFQQAMVADNAVTKEQAEYNDFIQGNIALLSLGSIIVSAVLFIRWLRRAYWNAAKLKPQQYPNHMAAWAFFIPFLNLYRPYQITRDTVETMQNYLDHHMPNYQKTKINTLLILWWGLFIGANIVSNIAFQRSITASSPQALYEISFLDMTGALLNLAGALATIFMIRAVAREERLLAKIISDN